MKTKLKYTFLGMIISVIILMIISASKPDPFTPGRYYNKRYTR